MWQAFAQNVRRSFTRAADQYDILTSLHKEIGRELVKKNVQADADRILDIGCGTGYAANKAKFFFPESVIVGLDLSEGMLSKASAAHEGIPIHWLQADAQALPFKRATFDLVLSNLSYQWVLDLPRAFREARRVLSGKGVLSGTLFGSRTCEELFLSLKAVHPVAKMRCLPSVDDVRNALQSAGFTDVHVDYELIKVQFKDVWELLNWLKAIGANTLAEEFFLGKQMLHKLDVYYRERFPYHDGICVSFEVIWIGSKVL